MSKPENPAAFPGSINTSTMGDIYTSGNVGEAGMTLWDYHASNALIGILSHGVNPEYVRQSEARSIAQFIAWEAGAIADAMLTEREKRK